MLFLGTEAAIRTLSLDFKVYVLQLTTSRTFLENFNIVKLSVLAQWAYALPFTSKEEVKNTCGCFIWLFDNWRNGREVTKSFFSPPRCQKTPAPSMPPADSSRPEQKSPSAYTIERRAAGYARFVGWDGHNKLEKKKK